MWEILKNRNIAIFFKFSFVLPTFLAKTKKKKMYCHEEGGMNTEKKLVVLFANPQTTFPICRLTPQIPTLATARLRRNKSQEASLGSHRNWQKLNHLSHHQFFPRSVLAGS